MNAFIVKYRTKLALKRLIAKALDHLPRTLPHLRPAVTVFISSLNTLEALQLTLRTLTSNTRYSNYQIRVADNASTDGSREYLEALARKGRIELTCSDKVKKHSEWLDTMYREVKTPYWVAVDSDMLFMGQDWLADMVSVMERDPDIQLLSAECGRARINVPDPVAGGFIDTAEAPSTWLFCVRTALREKLDVSFGFHAEPAAHALGRPLCYDTGAKLLSELHRLGLRYECMPLWYRAKYHHFGSLSWGLAGASGAYRELKEAQLLDIRDRIARLGTT